MGACQTLWLAAHLWSVHVSPVPNDRNFGAGLECDNSIVNIQAGYYHNSLGVATQYAVIGQDWGTPRWKIGGFIGATTGYYVRPCCSLVLGARFTYQIDGVRLQVLALPPGGVGRPASLHLMASFRLP